MGCERHDGPKSVAIEPLDDYKNEKAFYPYMSARRLVS